jgi:hypothetical protein
LDAGFRRAATMMELTAPPSDVSAAAGFTRKLELSTEEMNAHAAGFTFARFAQDSLAPAGAGRRLMAAWITNSLAGRRQVLAEGRNFCTYALDGGELVIDLLSCIDRERGSAARLLAGIRAVAAEASAEIVRVTTEAENIPALRSYLRAGFTPVASRLALHLHHPGDWR